MMRKLPPKYIANFDSSVAMVRSTARFLQGKDFPTLGLAPFLKGILPLANQLPKKAREMDFALGSWAESVRPESLDSVRAEDAARWITGLYPEDRQYPAVMVGATNGAMVHLAAALGVPWLPQSLLIPVSQLGVHPDDVKEGMEAGIEPGRRLLRANPDFQLHHVHDPNQHRLMLHLMTAFRVKWIRLARAYRQFISRTLAPGGTIIVLDCTLTWPTTQVGDRHFFQFGVPGGAEPEELMHGSDRVRDFLQRYGSHREGWDAPEPDADRPEAEWGFEGRLLDDIEDFADERGYRIIRLGFERPEDPSPFVADLFRAGYRERNLFANRLLVSSAILHDPWWTLQTGSAPFWLSSPVEPAAGKLERYLDESEPFDYIHAMLFSHGVESVGLAGIDRWRRILSRARKQGSFVGVDEEEFPRDVASLSRYHDELKQIPSRYGIPGSMRLSRVKEFLDSAHDLYPVQWIEEEEPATVG